MTFQNDTPVFLWGFALVYSTFVGMMAYLLVRDGVPADTPPLLMGGVMAVFAAAAIGLCLWVSRKRRLRVEVEHGGALLVTWRSPWKSETRRVAPREVLGAELVEGLDSDNDPYFRTTVRLTDGTTLDIAESHAREVCEQALRRFEEARGGRRAASRSA